VEAAVPRSRTFLQEDAAVKLEDSVSAFRDRFDAVVMLTVSDWHSEPRSNRYHFATRFARATRVLFVQPDHGDAGYAFEASGCAGIEILHVSAKFDLDQAGSIAQALTERKILKPLIWIYSGYYANVIDILYSPYRIFHATEDYFSPELLRQVSQKFFAGLTSMFQRIDLLIAVSDGVAKSYRQRGNYNGASLLLENGCDFAFCQWQGTRADGSRWPRQEKVIFYQGGINYRIDYDLVVRLVRLMPDWEFWFCGTRDPADARWSAISRMKNVRYLGQLSPEQVACKAWQASVGIIPFVRTPFIQEKSLPLKAFEYVACGLPVVTVPIRSLEKWPELFTFAESSEEFAETIRRVAPKVSDPSLLAQRLIGAAQQDYDRRFEVLLAEITERRPRPQEHLPLKILVLYAANSTFPACVMEHITSFARYSRHSVHFAHAVGGVDCQYDMSKFDVVILHYGVRLIHKESISSKVVEALRTCGAYKIMFIQDEYENVETTRRWMDLIGFHAVFTCIPDQQAHLVYPPTRFPSTELVPTLTGFVPEELECRTSVRPLAERPIVIGYRGRQLPFRFGRLAHEKFQIGSQMRSICEQRSISADIEWAEEKRIYGPQWYEFIANCRAILGTESGSNVFDENGSLTQAMDDALRHNPALTFEEIHRQFLAHRDGQIRMNQVSPGMFEAAALRTAVVLFEGKYSGILQPREHYIPLKKDFSNVDWVLKQLEDVPELERMVDRTYRDIVRSGKYTYRAFVSTIDDFLEARIRSPKPWVLQSKIVGAVRTGARLEQGDERSGAIVGSAVSWPTLPAQFEPATDLGKDRPATDLGKDRPATDLGKGGWSSSLRRAILVSQFRLLRLFPSPIESALRKYVANLTKIGSRLPVRRLRG
jgi:glycosyltransferase involved in cell wall biosynthesis